MQVQEQNDVNETPLATWFGPPQRETHGRPLSSVGETSSIGEPRMSFMFSHLSVICAKAAWRHGMTGGQTCGVLSGAGRVLRPVGSLCKDTMTLPVAIHSTNFLLSELQEDDCARSINVTYGQCWILHAQIRRRRNNEVRGWKVATSSPSYLTLRIELTRWSGTTRLPCCSPGDLAGCPISHGC